MTKNNNFFKTQERALKIKALALVVPLLLFILVFFIIPIVLILVKSVYSPKISELIPNTIKVMDTYHYKNAVIPSEEILKIFLMELQGLANNRQSGILAEELNRRVSGFGSTIKKTSRKIKRKDLNKIKNYKEHILKITKKWNNPKFWMVMKNSGNPFTFTYLLASFDLQYDIDGNIISKESKIYLPILMKTIYMAFIITILTILLAYPTSYYLSIIPKHKANLLMIFILLPFWTSLLVRIVSWITLLQDNGVINETLLALGFIDKPLSLVFNQFATIITMTHILLPFMVLPLYGSMRAMDPSYVKASASLGANPFITFIKVYFPLTLSGLSAGSILVFIMSVGYYITPALVGGVDGQMISNLVEFHMRTSNNWELASALGVIMLTITLFLYWAYGKMVGVNNIRLG
jgi:putative spermidine/putrescine transport system permease protein